MRRRERKPRMADAPRRGFVIKNAVAQRRSVSAHFPL
jgi:hypothetical protein